MSLITRTPVVCLLLWLAGGASAQMIDPVKWSLEVEPSQAAPGGKAVAKLTATVQDGWHLYSSTTPQGKPIALELDLAENPAVESWTAWQPTPARWSARPKAPTAWT